MSNIELKNIQDIIKDNSLNYGSYTIRNRALPDIRDGLKPVHRRIVWTMNEMKATSFTKSANIEGNVMKYHPHAGSYPTMVGMVQTDNNLTPLIVGKGNFAQYTSKDLQPGAARYTEAKLSEIAKDMLKDLDKDIVNFIPNYDGTRVIPEVLPVKFPSILHYAQEGIAYGMSCKIPSFNLVELNESAIKFLKNGEKTLLVPDFATGGNIIYNDEILEKINYEGKGSIRMRAKLSIDKNVISITEIPYGTTRESIIDKIVSLHKLGKLKEITNIIDLTGKAGMEIEITCRKNVDMEMLVEKLYKMTPLESSYNCNMNVINNNLPKVMGVWEIIENWLSFRRDCIRRKTKFELDKLKEELNILSGLLKIYDNIDKAIEIIRFSKENEIEQNLMKEFGLNKKQAKYIEDMKLKNINQDYIKSKVDEMDKLKEKGNQLEETLHNEEKVNNIIIKELKEINKKYGQERRSNILHIDEKIKEIKKKIQKVENEKPIEDIKVIITNEGYIKKLKLNDTKEHKFKMGDFIKQEFITKSNAQIIVFSGTNAYKIYMDEYEFTKNNDLGEYIKNIIGTDEIDHISICDDIHKFILIGYEHGKVAKVDLNSFKTKQRRRKLENSLSKMSKAYKILTFIEDKKIIFKDDRGRTLEKCTSEIVAKTSRATQGIYIQRDTVDFDINEKDLVGQLSMI